MVMEEDRDGLTEDLERWVRDRLRSASRVPHHVGLGASSLPKKSARISEPSGGYVRIEDVGDRKPSSDE